MVRGPCSFILRTPKDHPRRAVAFLRHSGAAFVDAYDEFEGLDEETKDYFKTSFDYFLEDVTLTKYKHRYHGWNKWGHRGAYEKCFVFKCPPHRLYGFLCHPKEPRDGRFYMCVLVAYGLKKKKHTDQRN